MEKKVLNLITAIRESFGGSVSVYEFGNCYQLYEILKTVFPDAEAFDRGGHVWTKIDGEFYDILGKKIFIEGMYLKPIIEKERIELLSVNKWTDERRKDYSEKWKKDILARK